MQYLTNAKRFIENAPNGSLSMQNKGGHTYFYHKYIDRNGKQSVKYLNKKNKSMISALAQKCYYKELINELEKRLKLIKKLQKCYARDLDNIYDNLSEEKKMYVVPVEETLEQKISNWKNKEITIYNEYPDTLRFHTQRGEVVRSKSELMIADLLYKNKNYLDYRYEQELILINNCREIVIHPDFEIINLKTGKIVYWEHAGKMDDTKYVNGFMNKVNLYSSNNIIIGKDVFFTCEDMNHPLDTLQISQIIAIIKNDEQITL